MMLLSFCIPLLAILAPNSCLIFLSKVWRFSDIPSRFLGETPFLGDLDAAPSLGCSSGLSELKNLEDLVGLKCDKFKSNCVNNWIVKHLSFGSNFSYVRSKQNTVTKTNNKFVKVCLQLIDFSVSTIFRQMTRFTLCFVVISRTFSLLIFRHNFWPFVQEQGYFL